MYNVQVHLAITICQKTILEYPNKKKTDNAMQFFGVIVDFLIGMINILFMTSPIICILPEANIIMVPHSAVTNTSKTVPTQSHVKFDFRDDQSTHPIILVEKLAATIN